MKKSELRQLIREEVSRLTESVTNPYVIIKWSKTDQSNRIKGKLEPLLKRTFPKFKLIDHDKLPDYMKIRTSAGGTPATVWGAEGVYDGEVASQLFDKLGPLVRTVDPAAAVSMMHR